MAGKAGRAEQTPIKRERKEHKMFEKFGNLGSAEEINEIAQNLLEEGDKGSIKALAKENGLEEEIADLFIDGTIPNLCDPVAAAIGKIDMEAAELKPAEIMRDWVEYVKARCIEDEETARAVRKTDKTLKGMIAALLEWSFGHQYSVDGEIMKAAGVTAGKCTLGIPGMGTAKRLIGEYYGVRA